MQKKSTDENTNSQRDISDIDWKRILLGIIMMAAILVIFYYIKVKKD